MKKLITLLLFITLYNVGWAQWTEINNTYPGVCCGGRGCGAFSIGGTCYFVGGGPYYYDTWAFDTLGDTWTQEQNYPKVVDGTYVGFSLNGLGYIATGVGYGYGWDSSLWQFNPAATTQWTELAHFPGQPRGYAVGFTLDGRLFLGCGIGNSPGSGPGLPLSDFYEYNPGNNTWTQIANYPGLGEQLDVSFVVGDKAYVGCGSTINSGGSGTQVNNDFWEYDTTSKVWTQIASLPGTARYGASGLSNSEFGFVGLGGNQGASIVYNDFWEYNPRCNTWTQMANFPGNGRYVANQFVIGNSFFVGLGVNGSNGTQADIWEYISTGSSVTAYTPAFSADTFVCQGGSVTFKDTSNYAPTNWYWQFPGGTPDTSTSDSVSIAYDDTGYHDVILSAWNSCDSATDTFANYVHVGAGGVLTISPSPDSICNGQSSVVYVKGGGSGFIWKPSTGITDSTLSGDSITISPTTNTIYSVTGTGTGGCAFYGTDTITIKSASSFNILPVDTDFCSSQSAILYVSGGGSDFIWTPTSGITDSTLSGDSVTVSPTATTTYTVTGMNSVGCAASGMDVVGVIPSPGTPTFTRDGDTLISSSVHDNQWYRNDSLLKNDTSQYLITHKPGEYYVVVTNEVNGCSTASDSVYTGIQQLVNISNQLSIYPNPFNDNVIIKINTSAGDISDWNLQVIDVLGRTILGKLSLDYNNDIDLSNLASGVYFITVINKTGRAVFPVVKQN